MSFELDTTGLLDMAAQMFNGLGPAFILPLGISLGIGLLTLVVREIKKAF